MKKIFIGVVLSVLFVAQSTFAMTFSQPVKIGSIWLDTAGKRGNGYILNDVLSNNGTYYTRYKKNNQQSYEKGVAQFGNSKESIFVHYNIVESSRDYAGAYFGAKDVSNTVRVPIWEVANILQIKNDYMQLYSIDSGYGGVGHCAIIGKRKDGVWVKYIDTRAITEKYFGKSTVGNIFYDKPNCNANQIIIKYNIFNKPVLKGEFRFKWDEAAQWFGVEQVVY